VTDAVGPVSPQIGIIVGIAAEAKAARRLSANILCSGGRPDIAAHQAQQLIATGATTLMSFGIAGGLSSTLRPGSLVVADEIITDFYRYPALSSCASAIRAHVGPIYGSWTIVSDPAEKRALRKRTGALAVDMESGPVARVAMEAGIPFIALRAIADPVTHGLPPAALLPLDEKGRPDMSAVFWSILTNPGQIPALIGTGNQTKKALLRLRGAAKKLSSA
jgi:adenosylhomocysteine nucleosidase